MNKLNKLCCAIALASVAGAANADLFSIDGDADSTPSALLTALQFTTIPTSYYVDGNGNGFVDQGEVVFDFGLSVQVSGLINEFGVVAANLPGSVVTDGYMFDYGMSFDYFLIGTAQVGGDGTADTIGEVASIEANFNQGMLNLFLDTDIDFADDFTGTGGTAFDRDLLALTYDVYGSSGNPASFDIFGDIVYAASGIFFDEDGNDYAGQEGLDGLVNVQVSAPENITTPIPGTVVGDTPTPTGAAIDGGVLGPIPTFYHGDSIEEITQAANGCTSNSGLDNDRDGAFGCENNNDVNLDVPLDPTVELWREIRDFVRDLDEQGNPVLARSTLVSGELYNRVPEPSSLAFLALGLLGLARYKKSMK